MKTMTNLKLGAALLSAGMLLSHTANATELSYSNAQLGYQMMTGDGSFSGFLLKGSFLITDDIYVAASYDQLKDGGISQDIMTLRGGMRFAMDDKLDLYGELGLARAKIDVEMSIPGWGTISESASETGFQLEGGARMMLADNLEGRAFFRHVSIDNYDENFIGAEAAFVVADRISVVGGISRLFDASEFLLDVGVRYEF